MYHRLEEPLSRMVGFDTNYQLGTYSSIWAIFLTLGSAFIIHHSSKKLINYQQAHSFEQTFRFCGKNQLLFVTLTLAAFGVLKTVLPSRKYFNVGKYLLYSIFEFSIDNINLLHYRESDSEIKEEKDRDRSDLLYDCSCSCFIYYQITHHHQRFPNEFY